MRAAIEPHEVPYPGDLEPDYDAESACVQCVDLHRQIQLLKLELAATRCRHCQQMLPTRAFEAGDRLWCSPTCWIADTKRPTDVGF